MRLYDIFRLMEAEDETPHWEALEKTGYYGKQAAGAIPFARDTKRFLIAHRSRYVEQPGTWGTWGGAVNEGESPEGTARREFQEETGVTPSGDAMPLGECRLRSGKKVVAWAFEGDLPELFEPKSNLFEMEWPPHSGKYKQFPEIDQAVFFSEEVARRKIKPAQVAFLDRLRAALAE